MKSEKVKTMSLGVCLSTFFPSNKNYDAFWQTNVPAASTRVDLPMPHATLCSRMDPESIGVG
jgi:hypothetical protein